MGQMLNKILLTTVLSCLINITAFSQEKQYGTNTFDYKDPDQFKNFNKRRKVIAVWQINELKEGAVVVRLKNNKLLLDQLKKAGKEDMAERKVLEQYAINKNTMMAYKDFLVFCKVYFIYSNSSDSLLNGARSGIFLDTNLNIDPSIRMQENFYLLAERDYGYNSSIGFVKEDSARTITEKGNAVRQMSVVLKNKYGHQLKSPFPYQIKEKNYLDESGFDFPIGVSKSDKGTTISYTVDKTYFADIASNPKNRATKMVKETATLKKVEIQKQYTYEKVGEAIDQLNTELIQFFRQAPGLDKSRLNKDFLPYLY